MFVSRYLLSRSCRGTASSSRQLSGGSELQTPCGREAALARLTGKKALTPSAAEIASMALVSILPSPHSFYLSFSLPSALLISLPPSLSPFHPPTHPPSLTRPLTHPLIHPPTHSPTHPSFYSLSHPLPSIHIYMYLSSLFLCHIHLFPSLSLPLTRAPDCVAEPGLYPPSQPSPLAPPHRRGRPSPGPARHRQTLGAEPAQLLLRRGPRPIVGCGPQPELPRPGPVWEGQARSAGAELRLRCGRSQMHV